MAEAHATAAHAAMATVRQRQLGWLATEEATELARYETNQLTQTLNLRLAEFTGGRTGSEMTQRPSQFLLQELRARHSAARAEAEAALSAR
jgi:hypothetical protein